MPGPTSGASVKHKSGTHHGGRVKRIEIELHNEGGHTVTHHYEQGEPKGQYKEPTSSAHGHHGSVMAELHETMTKHGKDQKDTDCSCGYCGSGEETEGKAEKYKEE